MKVFPRKALFVSQAFGFLPLKVVGKGGNVKLQYSPMLYVWDILFIAFLAGGTVCAMFLDWTEERRVRIVKGSSLLPTLLDVVPLVMMAVVTFRESTKKCEVFIEIFKLLRSFDQNFQNTLKVFPFRLNAITILVPFSILLICYESFNISQNLGEVIYIPYLLNYYVQAAFFVHFTCIAHSIADRFKVINNSFRNKLVKRQYTGSLKTKEHLERELLTEGGFSVEQVRYLVDGYSLLCEAVRKANRLYGGQLLFAIFSSFVHIMNTLYTLITTAWPVVKPSIVPDLLTHGFWVTFHILHLVLLTRPCSTVAEVPAKTSAVVCRLINSDIDKDSRRLLEKFLLKLIHYKPNLSALGFFIVNSSLLTSIASSVATYSVIMIQFYASSQSPE